MTSILPLFLLLLFHLFSFSSSSSPSLELHFSNNSSLSVPSHYTTLGYSKKEISANISLINKTNITPNCKLQNKNISEINGSILVYIDSRLPFLYECCSDKNGNAAAFAEMMQSYGAVGIIVIECEKV